MLLIFVSYLIYLPLTIQWTRPQHPDENLSITQLITKYGYPVKTHQIQTEDGYILRTQRIPHGKSSTKPNDKVVLLVHGLAGSAENFVLLGADGSLSFLLADRGFDVWLFNARGTVHSRRHRFLSPDFFLHTKKFWDFSWHEMGIYDLPANIDYILTKTKKKKLFYIGYSQGTTSYFVLMSEKPEYNEKIEFGAMLAPPILMNCSAYFLREIARFNPEIGRFFNKLNYHELVIPKSPLFNPIHKKLCLSSERALEVCFDTMYLIGGMDSGLLNRSMAPIIFDHTPSGFSVRQILHYLQEMSSGLFRKYDYGRIGNLLKYRREDPPMYNLSNSRAPVALFFGASDDLASISQRKYLQRMIPNIFTIYVVPYDKFNHVDFILAYNARKLVYDPVYQVMMDFMQA